ncbi:MAG: NifB/NifX family molybdenum-iron cluster-binding protein [Anaerolineales bacterium]
MKIAVITDDGITISRHFGRAQNYQVLTVQDGKIITTELRAKPGHTQFRDGDHEHLEASGQQHGYGPMAEKRHSRMAEVISDCQVVLCRGMGKGAYDNLQALGIQIIVTDLSSIDKAVSAFLDGSIVDHKERLH